jgi:hypothetical protein
VGRCDFTSTLALRTRQHETKAIYYIGLKTCSSTAETAAEALGAAGEAEIEVRVIARV